METAYAADIVVPPWAWYTLGGIALFFLVFAVVVWKKGRPFVSGDVFRALLQDDGLPVWNAHQRARAVRKGHR